MTKLSLGAVWLPSKKPNTRSAQFVKYLKDKFPGITSGNFNTVDDKKCKILFLLPETNKFEDIFDGSAELRNKILEGEITVILVYKPDYSPEFKLYNTRVFLNKEKGNVLSIKGLFGTTSKAESFVKNLYEQSMAKEKTLEDFGGDMDMYMDYCMSKSDTSSPKQDGKIIKLRFKTKEEFKRDGSWEKLNNVPRTWNGQKRMNQYIGISVSMTESAYNIARQLGKFLASDISCEIKLTPSDLNWTFQFSDLTDIDLIATPEKVSTPQPERVELIVRFKTEQEFKESGLWDNVTNLPNEWTADMYPLIGAKVLLTQEDIAEIQQSEKHDCLNFEGKYADTNYGNAPIEEWEFYANEFIVSTKGGLAEVQTPKMHSSQTEDVWTDAPVDTYISRVNAPEDSIKVIRPGHILLVAALL